MPLRSALFLLFCLPTLAWAQIGTTDRPGLGISTETLGDRQVAIELGVPRATFVDDVRFFGESISITQYSLPLVVRFGVGESIEFRAGTSLYDGFRFSGVGESDSDGEIGFDALTVGAKFGIGQPESGGVALLPEVVFATDGQFDPLVRLTLASGKASDSGIGGMINVGVVASTQDVVETAVGSLLATLGYAFSPQATTFVEGLIQFDGDDNSGLLGLGATFSPVSLVKLDASIYAGLTDTAPDILFNLGIVIRP